MNNSIPDGYALVPTKLTQPMLFAANGIRIKCGADIDGHQIFTQLNSAEAIELFEAFLSTAPMPPTDTVMPLIKEADEILSTAQAIAWQAYQFIGAQFMGDSSPVVVAAMDYFSQIANGEIEYCEDMGAVLATVQVEPMTRRSGDLHVGGEISPEFASIPPAQKP